MTTDTAILDMLLRQINRSELKLVLRHHRAARPPGFSVGKWPDCETCAEFFHDVVQMYKHSAEISRLVGEAKKREISMRPPIWEHQKEGRDCYGRPRVRWDVFAPPDLVRDRLELPSIDSKVMEAQRAIARYDEAELRDMFGQWQSESEPSICVRVGTHEIIGLSMAGVVEVGQRSHIVVAPSLGYAEERKRRFPWLYRYN